jgi:hypothetical protein
VTVTLIDGGAGVPVPVIWHRLSEGAQPSSALGLTYLSILLLLVVFTNVRLRGIHSVVALLTVAFISVLLAWFGWWDDIAKLIPYLSVHMNTGFYLVFSTGLLINWLIMFFVFDRPTYWRIRPGQMTEEHLIGGAAESFDTNGLRFQKLGSDFFRAVLGFGAGDLKATIAGGATIEIANVIFVDRKVHAIEKLISVKPERPPNWCSRALPQRSAAAIAEHDMAKNCAKDLRTRKSDATIQYGRR